MKYIAYVVILFSISEFGIANDSLSNTKTAAPVQGNSFALPKDLNTLRQMLIDTNRKIEESEKTIKNTEVAISLVEETQQQTEQVKYSPEVIFSSIKSSVTSGDYSKLPVQIQELYFNFFGSYSGLRRINQELTPGSEARRAYSALQQRIDKVVSKYQKNMELLPNKIPQPFDSNSDEFWSKQGFALAQSDVAAIENIFSVEKKGNFDAELKDEFSKGIGELNKILEKHQGELNRFLQLRGAITAAETKAKGDINELAIQLGLPLFCITIVVLFVIPFFAQRTLRRTNDDGVNLPGSFNFSTLVEISTVLLLTMSILILGLADKLEPAVLGTLLGGISGYVLNKTNSRVKSASEAQSGDIRAGNSQNVG